MTNIDTVLAIISVVFALMAWVIKLTWDEIRIVKNDGFRLTNLVYELKSFVSHDYITKSDFNEFTREVLKQIERIFNKIDMKVDK